MYRVALNTAITGVKKKPVIYSQIDKKTDQIYWESDEDVISKNEEIELLINSISKLNDVEKALIYLYMEELTYYEISEITGLSQSNVGVKINRIKSKLSNIIQSLK